MKPFVLTAIAAGLLVATAASIGPAASAKTTALPRNDKIVIDYHRPLNPELIDNLDPKDPDKNVQQAFANYHRYLAIYQRLKAHRLLERYAQFLAPLRLPMTLRLDSRECGQVNAYFSANDGSINLCYELVANLEDNAPRSVTPDGISPDDAVVGALVGIMLHETGHAIFYMYHIPILGREEDAADQIAAFIMLQFGDQVALTTVKGMLWFAHNMGAAPYSDVHSTPLQRFNAFLCTAYGAKPKLFQPFIDKKYLVLYRPQDCHRLYEQIKHAFVLTVLPHIDPKLMKIVQSATWFLPSDKGIIPVQTR